MSAPGLANRDCVKLLWFGIRESARRPEEAILRLASETDTRRTVGETENGFRRTAHILRTTSRRHLSAEFDSE
jgi:hypothetical protein